MMRDTWHMQLRLQKQVSDLDLEPTKVFGWSATFCSALDSGGDQIAITDLGSF